MKNFLGKRGLLSLIAFGTGGINRLAYRSQNTFAIHDDIISLLMAEFMTVKRSFEYIMSNKYIGE
jgi:hypothetical protein